MGYRAFHSPTQDHASVRHHANAVYLKPISPIFQLLTVFHISDSFRQRGAQHDPNDLHLCTIHVQIISAFCIFPCTAQSEGTFTQLLYDVVMSFANAVIFCLGKAATLIRWSQYTFVQTVCD